MFTDQYQPPDLITKKNKFELGDIVFRRSEIPLSALGHKQSTTKFRTGDYTVETVPRKIEQIFYYSGSVPYRYMISGVPNVAYPESDLVSAPVEEKEEKYVINKIIDKRIHNKKVEYLVWWKKYLKKNSTWQDEKQLIEDGAQEYIDDFIETEKKNRKAKK